jgi:hypothetical protein
LNQKPELISVEAVVVLVWVVPVVLVVEAAVAAVVLVWVVVVEAVVEAEEEVVVVAAAVLVWVVLVEEEVEEAVVVGNFQPLWLDSELLPINPCPLAFYMTNKSRHLFSLIPWPWRFFPGSTSLLGKSQLAQWRPLSHRIETVPQSPDLVPRNEIVGRRR